MAKKKKTLLEKAADVVDQVIHQDAHKNICPVTDAPCESECAQDECKKPVSDEEAQALVDSGKAEIPSEAIVNQSSSEKSDYASHPKFDKFKSTQGVK